jgi:hypothetical protein
VAPQLDRIFQGERAGEAEGTEISPREEHTVPAATAPDNVWIVIVRPYRGYDEWDQLEQALRRHYKDMQVVALQMGFGEARIELTNVDASIVERLRDLELRRMRVQVQRQDTVQRAVIISLIPLEKNQ